MPLTAPPISYAYGLCVMEGDLMSCLGFCLMRQLRSRLQAAPSKSDRV